jgi:hypothetical protein
MKSEHEVTDDFETHLAENGGGYLDPELIKHTTGAYEQWPAIVKTLSFADPELIAAFANACGPTVQWLKTFGVKFDFLPTQFLTKSQPRLLPIGGGLALVEALATAAEILGVKTFYETTAVSLTQDETLAITGLNARGKSGEPLLFKGKVILGCGGFEGNHEMQTRYIGPRAVYLRPVARGGYYNKGEGIRMALDIGAAVITPSRSIRARADPSRRCLFSPMAFSSIRKACASPTKRRARWTRSTNPLRARFSIKPTASPTPSSIRRSTTCRTTSWGCAATSRPSPARLCPNSRTNSKCPPTCSKKPCAITTQLAWLARSKPWKSTTSPRAD